MSDYLLSFDPGTKNIAYCLIEVATKKIIDWKIFSIASTTYEGRCRNLAKELDKLNPIGNLPEGSKITVIVEQQMGINTKTNRISGMLFMYYVRSNQPIKKIVQYPAKYKNNYYKWEDGDPLPFKGKLIKKGKAGKDTYFVNEYVAKLGTQYNRTKKSCIEHCKRLLKRTNQEQPWIDYFEANKSKQDDLSDGFIQGLSYIDYPNGNNDKNWLKKWDLKIHGLAEPSPPKSPKQIKKIVQNTDDKILNPATGRYVKKNSKLGIKLASANLT